MASNTGWSKTVPSGTSSVAQGDDEFRSLKSFVQAWWEEEHYATDGSSSSAGEHKLGSARAYVGPASQLSNPESGRMFWLTDQNDIAVAASSSSWSILGAVRVGSVNTFTAKQFFEHPSSTSDAVNFLQSSDTFSRYVIRTDGLLEWGSGIARDTNLYRAAANHLKTDDVFEASEVSTGGLSLQTLQVGSGAVLSGVLSATSLIAATGIAGSGGNETFDIAVTSATSVDVPIAGINIPSAFPRISTNMLTSGTTVRISVQNDAASTITIPAQTLRAIVFQV